MLCDLHGYELSARGSMCGDEAAPLVDAIVRVPADCVTHIDLRNVFALDADAADALADAVRLGCVNGLEISIEPGAESNRAMLRAAGLADVMSPGRHSTAA